MITPEAFPDNTLATSPSALCSISAALISLTAYPRAFFSLLIPWAVTITVSNSTESSLSLTFSEVELATTS